MNRILVSGSLAYDRIMDFPGKFRDHFLPDKLHSISVGFSVSTPIEQFGGTAGNIAYTLSLLEEHPEIIGSAGSGFSPFREHLLKHGIDTESIQIIDGIPTASAYTITDEDDNQISAFSGEACEKPYAKLIDLKRYARAIVSPGCVEDMTAIPELCRANGLPFFFDPGQRIPALSKEQLESGVTGADVVFANDYEMGLIEEKTGLDERGLLTKAKALVITYGVEGSRIVTNEGEKRIASTHVEHPVDPTGAGDAYRAGFLKGALASLPLEACASLGSVAAAYAVEKYGTQNHSFTLQEFRARFEAAYGTACPI